VVSLPSSIEGEGSTRAISAGVSAVGAVKEKGTAKKKGKGGRQGEREKKGVLIRHYDRIKQGLLWQRRS